MSRGRHEAKRQAALDYSKRLTNDMRGLLWVISLGGLALAFYCVHAGYTEEIRWVTAMVGLPWTAWGTAAAFYLNLAKSDHKKGGITYDAAMAELGAEAENNDESNDFGEESI